MGLFFEHPAVESYVGPVENATAETKLFGTFFNDVEGCRHLMKEKQVIASGSAVLFALEQCSTWSPSDLDFFVSTRSLGNQGLFNCHQFLRSEGYSLSRETREGGYFGSQVSIAVVLIKL